MVIGIVIHITAMQAEYRRALREESQVLFEVLNSIAGGRQ